jgi:cytochrome c oxidase subunit 4
VTGSNGLWPVLRPNLWTLIGLFVLLALTVWLAYVPMHGLNAVASFGIAAAKALLVAIVFMQLRRRDALLRLAATAALFWLITLFGLTFADYLTRSRPVNPSMENGTFAPDARSGRTD